MNRSSRSLGPLRSRTFSLVCLVVLTSALSACEGSSPPTTSPTGAAGGATDGGFVQAGEELRIPVPESGRAYVTLAPPRVVTPADGSTPATWDLAFEGYAVTTNGGASGQGHASVFGPLEVETFASDSAPAVPFMNEDRASGAFLAWYLYEGAPRHVLWSRYHTVGVREGGRTWKVQILSYYGEQDGAPVGGLYRLRWAEVGANGIGEVQERVGVDGTAGGPSTTPTTPSECLDLASGAVIALTPAEALASSAWHLCFRRQNVTVNGGIGGPRGATAFDLQGDATESETLSEIKARTEETTLADFSAVDAASFVDRPFAADHIASGFGTAWLDEHASPPAPAPGTWIVRDASGERTFFVGFTRFEGATTTSPGTVVLQTKALNP